jgi:hypothetical protein
VGLAEHIDLDQRSPAAIDAMGRSLGDVG